MENLHILAFVGRCFSSVITKRRQALLHYLIIQPTRDSSSLSLFHFISFSLCLSPSLRCSTHILYPPIPLVAAKALTDKLQGRQREKEMARERSWHQSTLFSLFAMFPIFAFFTPPSSTSSLFPSVCLAF